MNQALVQDVVSEVMRRLGNRSGRGGIPAGETARAEEPKRAEATRRPHAISEPIGQHGVFDNVDQAVSPATEAQKKLVRLSLDERDSIVKLVKAMAKENAQAWGKMELDETKIGR